jgi:zinc protease
MTLANGMKVALLPKKTRGQTVKIALQIDQGDEKSLFGTSPQGALTAAMLTRGTTKHSRQEIEDTLDRLRAKVTFNGTDTKTSATAETYRAELPDTLRLVAEMLRQPSFPATEFANLVREEVTDLESARTDPEAIARRAMRRYGNPYPAGDPRYVPTIEEAIARVQKTSVDDVKRFHSRFVGGIGEIAIVGDFDPDAVRAVLAEAFGSWPKTAPFARVPEPYVKKAPTVLTFETPDKANAALFGDFAMSISDESSDYGATSVATMIIGETASSRLWKRIREREGLSYGVYSYVGWNSFEPNSKLTVQAIFAPQNRAKLATAVTEELARAARDGFTDDEVAEARTTLLKRRLLARTQDANVAAALVQQMYVGRTFAFTEKADAAIAAATPAAVNAAYRKYVQPDGLALVYAGDFAKAQ